MHFLLKESYLSKTRPPFMFLKENHTPKPSHCCPYGIRVAGETNAPDHS